MHARLTQHLKMRHLDRIIFMVLAVMMAMMVMMATPSRAVEIPANAHREWMATKHLRPTQSAVGFLEVEYKINLLEHMSDKERNEYLRENPVPAVVGPGGEFYILDHHHLSRAVQEAGYKDVFVAIIDDLRQLDEATFWATMESRGYVYLFDEQDRPITYQNLPKKLKHMTDDPYRSLAGAVFRRNGFEKTETPYMQMQWGRFFRQHLKFENTQSGLDKILKTAVRLAQSPDAAKLEGYVGPGQSCHFLFLKSE